MVETFEGNYDDYREENSESEKEEIDAAINHTKSDLDSFQSEVFGSGFNSINEFYRLEGDDLVYQLNKVRNYLASVSQRLQGMKKQKFGEVSKENNFKGTILAIKIALKAMGTDSENPKKYNIGKINGEYDEATIQAIKQFQTDNNLMWNDGKPGKETIGKLLEKFDKLIDKKKEEVNEQKKLKSDITDIIEESYRLSVYGSLGKTYEQEGIINYIIEGNLGTGKNTAIETKISKLIEENYVMNWKLQYLINHSKEPLKDSIAKIKEEENKRRNLLSKNLELGDIENSNYVEKLNILNKNEEFKNTKYDDLIIQFSKKYSTQEKIDPALIKLIMKKESRFRPGVVGPAPTRAKGLMQLAPITVTDLRNKGFKITNIFDPKQNIEGGIKVFSGNLNTYSGNIRYALVAYNRGGKNLRDLIKKIAQKLGIEKEKLLASNELFDKEVKPKLPKETREYVDEIVPKYESLHSS